jgi:hypothetical protein
MSSKIAITFCSAALVMVFFFLWTQFSAVGINPVPALITNNVVSASGIDWETEKLVTINPFDGTEVSPCKVVSDNLFISKSELNKAPRNIPKTVAQHDSSSCNPDVIPQIILSENVSAADLQQIIKTTEKAVLGEVKVGDKVKQARFYVTVTALYEGSHCATTYSAGSSRRYCRKNHAECVQLQQQGFSC